MTPIIDFQGTGLSVTGLERILQTLKDHGEVHVRNVFKDSVSLLDIGATLAELAQQKVDLFK